MVGRRWAILALLAAALLSSLGGLAAAEPEPRAGVEGTFSSAGVTTLRGDGALTFRLGGLSYGGEMWYSDVVPEPVAYTVEVEGARLELWETVEAVFSPVANEDHAPDRHRRLEAVPFSGTLRVDVAGPTRDTVHALAPAMPRENPVFAVETFTRSPPDVHLRLVPETPFTASLDASDPEGRPPSPVHWTSNPGNQSLDPPAPSMPARIDVQRARLEGPLVGLFLGGSIVSEGAGPRAWETGVSGLHGDTALPAGLRAATRYQYLMLHADGAVLELGRGGSQWTSHVRGLGGSMTGDALWHGVNGTVRYGADQSVYRSESLQVIGTFAVALDWPFNDGAREVAADEEPWSLRKGNEGATWSLAGEASFVAVDAQARFGSRLLVVSAVGLAALAAAILAAMQGKPLAMALLGRRTRDAFPVALASPCRRRMLRELLRGRPMSARDLAAALGKTSSTIRLHARVLKAQGLVRELRSPGGRRTAYVLGDARTAPDGGPLFAVFGNARRRALHGLLRAQGPLGAADLAALLEREGLALSRSALGRHLAELVAAGAVVERWQDRRKLYAAQDAPAAAPGLAGWCLAKLGLRPIADKLHELGALDAGQAAKAVVLPSGNGPRAVRLGLDYLVDLGVADRQGSAYRLVGAAPALEAPA